MFPAFIAVPGPVSPRGTGFFSLPHRAAGRRPAARVGVLRELPARQGEALALRYRYRPGPQETGIEAAMGISPRSVKIHAAHGMAAQDAYRAGRG